MENAELLNEIRGIIRNVVNNPVLAVDPESLLVGDLGLESIDFLDISSELENSLGREVDFKEMAEFISKSSGRAREMKDMSVRDLIQYVASGS